MDTVAKASLVNELYRRYQGQLVNYLTEMLGNRERARELAQDSFVKMHSAYSSARVHFPRAALFRIATNFALMEIRRRRVEHRFWGDSAGMEYEDVPDDDALPPDRHVLADEVAAHLAAAIKELRPNLRSVFVMAHIQEKPRREIAAILGVSEKRVDKRMTKALRQCRELLTSRGIRLSDVLTALALFQLGWLQMWSQLW